MEEIWKDIPEWEGFYQASTFGRVRSVDRVLMKQNSHGFLSPKKIQRENNFPKYK